MTTKQKGLVDTGETTETLNVGDRVTYKKKVGTVLSIGGMGYVRLVWDGQARRMDTPARFLTKVPKTKEAT